MARNFPLAKGTIPFRLLGSGKTDYVAATALARETAAPTEREVA